MSKKISMTNIIVDNLAKGGMTKVDAKAVAKQIMKDACTYLTDREGEVSFGDIGKLFSKTYEPSMQYNPAKRAKEMRPKYRTVRFKTYKGAKTAL